jgi:hypothetical protein
MSKQPEALRLADAIDRLGLGDDIAVELRRLHEVNVELLEACKAALSDDKPYIEKCRAAIAKATGE